MSDQFEGKTPSLPQLALLRNNRKKLRAKAASSGKKIITKGMVDPQPCVICGTIYEKYRSGDEPKPENCRSCQGKLNSGQCCVVCKVSADGLYDGRYLFLEPSTENGLAKNLVGKIVPCTVRTMDLLMAKKEGNVITVRCQVCGFSEIVPKSESDPKNAVVIESKCPDCRPNKFKPEAITFLNADGKEIK